MNTERLIYEPLAAEHAARVFAELRNPKLYTYIPQDPPANLESLSSRFERLAAEPHSADGSELWLNWIMRERESGEYVGTLEASVMPDQRAFIAYFVFEPYQRQGYAKEGVRALLDHLFERYDIGVAIAEIDTRNLASIALVRTLGFECVAHTVDADHFKGAASDEYRFELHRAAHLPPRRLD